MADFEIAFPITMRHEGGYGNDPTDPGGATNFGVTKRSWEAWLNRAVTIEDMQRLTLEEVRPFYRARYWDLLKLDGEPDQVFANALFDFFVNVSPRTFHKVMEAARPLTPDSFFREKMRHYFGQCRQRRQTLPPIEADKFLLGWGERALEMDT